VIEIAIHLKQVAVILEPLLETIARQELVEIAAFDRIRNLLEAPVPARRVVGSVLALAEQFRDQLAVLDTLDRAAQPSNLAIEGFDRVDVMIGGLLVGTELRERVGRGLRTPTFIPPDSINGSLTRTPSLLALA
jgi:hypothetical protein